MNLFFIFLILGCCLLFSRFHEIGRIVISGTLLFVTVISILPIGKFIFWKLENRFPQPGLTPKNVDGIIIVGGILDPVLSHDREQPVIGDAVERLTSASFLARKYPESKIVFSGGSGSIFDTALKEAHYVRPILADLGIAPQRVIIEDQARNTFENSVLTRNLVKPQPTEVWLLITSAFHMTRAVGAFRKAGWRIVPYPVDYSTKQSFHWSPSLRLLSGLAYFSRATRECLGLLMYWITGKSDTLYPGPKES